MSASPLNAGGQPADKPSARILVAEDNTDVAEILQAVLAGEPGLECVGAVPDGRDVAAAVARLQPDILLLDLELDGLSGMEVLRACQREHPSLLVVIVSGHSADAIIRAAKAAGAADFLVKPDDLPELAARLRRALSA